MATPSTATPNLSQTSLSGMAGGMGTTTTNLETVGNGAPSTTASLPIASGVTVNSPPVSRPTQVAYLTLSDTTVTALAVPGATGLAVLQGSGETLTFRAEGVTLSDGNVVSLGFDGLVESTTTAMYEPLTGVSAASSFASSSSGGGTGDLTSSYSLPTGPGPVLINSTFPFLTATTSSTSGDTELTGEQTSAGTLITTASSESANAATTSGGTGGGSAGGSESGASATQGSASPSASQDAAGTLSAGRAAMLLGAVGGLAAWGL